MKPLLKIEDFRFSYDQAEILHGISLDIHKNQIHALMGPSGCGKSTLLRSINRIYEVNFPNVHISGKILLDKVNLLDISSLEVRKNIGMVFQKPNPFPHMSIYDNVICGYKINQIKLTKKQSDEIVINTLKSVGLWEEVKENMKRKGVFLSGGQQQRLCIARALALKPKILLLDEPTSALDPFGTEVVEDLLLQLKDQVTIILVTHNLSQAKRIADNCSFMFLGNIIETNSKKEIFSNPKQEKTQQFIRGVIG